MQPSAPTLLQAALTHQITRTKSTRDSKFQRHLQMSQSYIVSKDAALRIDTFGTYL